MTLLHPTLLALILQAAPVWSPEERVAAVVRPLVGLLVAFAVFRFVQRAPWPRPFRLRFVVLHVVVALVAILAWHLGSLVIEAIFLGGHLPDRFRGEVFFIGGIVYTIVAGVSYAVEATARAARAEALAARTQLAALRAQIHPHFLFNALHAVVQLIPVQPARAAEAAELVADLLRTAVEEQRDEVTLGDEWRFVSRYLAIERMRFGDRLVVRAEIPAALLDERMPSFALQTLVENAVRHGAAPRVEPTEVAVTATHTASALTVTVRNAVQATPATPATPVGGTGIARLRERLAVLYGGAARLACGQEDGTYEAVLVVPRRRGAES
ncbi:MAG TPA: histidine kinase [Gemmatimonadaceae bacterium]|nr:histidine kinase [Gemmatimonadaceae bacterium]